MVPFSPRTVVPAAKVVVPLPSSAMRLPAPVAPSTMVPLPLRPPLPSKLRMPFWLMLMVPLSTRPPAVTRSRLLTTLAMSRLPLSVAPLRKLEALLMAVKRPLPLVLMVPLMVDAALQHLAAGAGHDLARAAARDVAGQHQRAAVQGAERAVVDAPARC